MPTVCLDWNGEALHRTFIDINKEDEISLAHFFCNFKELPLLDPFPDLPLSIKVGIYVFSLPITRCFIQNYGKLETAKRTMYIDCPERKVEAGGFDWALPGFAARMIIKKATTLKISSHPCCRDRDITDLLLSLFQLIPPQKILAHLL
jgi:hypothetical protein